MAKLSHAWMHHGHSLGSLGSLGLHGHLPGHFPGHFPGRAVGTTVVSIAVTGALLIEPGAVGRASAATTTVSDIPATYYSAYTKAAAKSCKGLRWYHLAGVGKIMSDHGRLKGAGVASGTVSGSRRAGPMMFPVQGSQLGDQWSRYRVDGSGNGSKNVWSPHDSSLGLARYLCANSNSTKSGQIGRITVAYHRFVGGPESAQRTDAVARIWAQVTRYSGAKKVVASTAPLRTGSVQQRAIATARSQKGTWYLWAGSPSSWTISSAKANDCLDRFGKPTECRFDCSSLLEWAYARQGVKIATYSRGQYSDGRRVPVKSAQPGDLVFFSRNGKQGGIHHVGMVTGSNRMIEAPHTGAKVREVAYKHRGELMPYAVRVVG
jgi:cell wall-associated NlpC family hydrolase